MRYVVLDTETTGLNVDDGHRVIEIGCVEIENRSLPDGSTIKKLILFVRLIRVLRRFME